MVKKISAPHSSDFSQELGAAQNDEGYFRYQLSWGGPSDEFRFYPDSLEDTQEIDEEFASGRRKGENRKW